MSEAKHEPEFTTDSVEDLDELLRRAANWAESAPTGKVVAEEIRDGRRFVQQEMSD